VTGTITIAGLWWHRRQAPDAPNAFQAGDHGILPPATRAVVRFAGCILWL
jgi:hypothetical protein